MNFGYVTREAFKGLGRNLTMTIALVITTAISVGLLVAGIAVAKMTEDTKAIYLEKVEVMVQFDNDISAKDTTCAEGPCAEVKRALEAHPGVEKVTYRNRAESYERFVEVFQETDPLLVQETSSDALPAALHVRLKDPSDTAAIDEIRDAPDVETIVDQVEEVRAATSNLDAIRNATFVLALVQALAAIFLIVNMVQLAAHNRSTEISIMRMVGASRWFTQAPFVLEAAFAVVLGSVLAGVAVFAGKRLVLDPSLESLYASQLIAPIRNSDIWTALPIVAALGVIFAGVAAQVTLRSYVRK